jgi:hypothetical protein
MADLSDVETALVTLIAGALYPNGTAQASAAGVPVVVYPGWPMASSLDADLAAGKVHVTVFPTAVERNTSRYPRDWQEQSLNTATLTLTVQGQMVTIGGAMPSPFTPHVLSLLVDGDPYPYQVQPTDTLASIAAALAELVGAASGRNRRLWRGAHDAAGARIDAARVGVTGTAIRELRRQSASSASRCGPTRRRTAQRWRAWSMWRWRRSTASPCRTIRARGFATTAQLRWTRSRKRGCTGAISSTASSTRPRRPTPRPRSRKCR